MKLILAVDALIPPLTGIGRYAWELASHYQACSKEFDSIRYYFADRWIADPADMLQGLGSEAVTPTRDRGFFRAPKSWRRWRMQRDLRQHVFHSPNYFLPESVDGGIVTVHDLSVFKYPETHPAARIKHFESGFASTLKRAAHLITDSEAIRAEVIDYFGWSPTRITAIGLGARQEFRPRSAHEIAAELNEHGLVHGEYSLCVSTLEPRKRIDRLLAAYLDLPSSLRTRYPLVLAGSTGWLSDALREQIERGEREGWLRYLGFVEEAFLPLLYSGARAFLFPSIYEGFGLPVLEAMASGIPTLTSNCSSLPEVADGAAWLVEPDDHKLLRDGIELVLCDETWRRAATARGLHVASTVSWERCAKRTLAVCRRFG
ncbi:glycosyltransferase family 4 protein [Paraburkholderia phenazinium]|uniref:Alpha-1,3-rhamnosyl/mannosyltransferase n=1 Tax=Paraburkholderia phenazinium TaxID=60549 RepID=A0A1G8E178_9BURK|nr:glycosyltransferase family 1 protein [Paraburkholderia phenazinium]SDH63429.1 alpha-1,3-rhamnosyl/mannosyltransferase [Paraburkholderia phenazinium]